MNSCVIFGRLGKDAEFSETKGGTKLLKFSLANNTGYGEKVQTNWFRCTMFGERGERLVDYLKKGSAVIVSGEVTLNKWTGKEDGVERSELSLMVRELSFAGGKKDSDGESSTSRPAAKQQSKSVGETISFDDDDIPF